MSRQGIKSRVVGLLREARTACVGLGYSVLLFAAGLAMWGWLVAGPSQFEGHWDPFDRVHGFAWRKDFPAGPAVSVIVVAAALIAVAGYSWARARRSSRPAVWLGPRFLAVCAIVYFAALSYGLPSFYHLVMGNFPVTAAAPIVVAAWLLALGGAVALLVSPPLPNLTRRATAAVAGGVALGVVVALASTMWAVGAGDDGRYVDATVAPAIDMPATPTALGQRRFSVKVSDWVWHSRDLPDVQVAPAGAGFVVFHQGRITAYGGDGKERWHYRRTGPGRVSVSGLRVFDEGRTVVAAVAVGATDTAQLLVGLDAVTGTQLWSTRSTLRSPEEESFYPERNSYGIALFEPTQFLVTDRGSDAASWTRIDTRTGKPMWTVNTPLGRGCYGRPVDTPTRTVAATVCSAGNRADVGVVVLDPASGQQVWQQTFAKDVPYSDKHPFSLSGNTAGQDAVELRYGAADHEPAHVYVNVVSHQMRDFGPRDTLEPSPTPGDVFLVAHSGDPQGADLSLYDSLGLRRCSLSPEVKMRRDLFGDHYLYAPLGSDVVIYDGKGHTFQTVDRDTCAVRAIQPASSAVDWLAVAPGLILVQRFETNGTFVDGYA